MRKNAIFVVLMIGITVVWAMIGYTGIDKIVSNTAMPKPALIIDAGHGGIDGGAVAADGTVEKDINLDIAKKLADIAEMGGFDVIMVREGDYDISDRGLDTIKSKKTSDIHNRLALTAQYPEALFVSIHQNHFEQPKYWGAQVFYGVKNPQSQILAEHIQNAICDILQKENIRKIKKAEKNLYILYNTDSTAVMVECGFLSNKDECAKLCDDEYRQQLAFEIFRAINEYYMALSGTKSKSG